MGKTSVTSQMTRRLLADSLKHLMETRSVSKITVREIVDGCGLNRQTFYYHFQDVYELVEWIIKEEALSQMEQHKSWTTWKDGVLAVLNYLKSNEKICLCAYQSVSRELLHQFLYSDIFDLFRHGIETLSENRDITQEERTFTAHFYATAFMGIAEHWLIDGMKETPEALVHYLSVMTEGGLEGIICRFEELKAKSNS